MNIKTLYTLGFAVAVLASCGDYLDKTPSKSTNTPVETADNLLSVYDYIPNRYKTNYFALYSTDDTEIPDTAYTSSPSNFNISYVVSPYTHYRDGIIANPTDRLWENEYTLIYSCNLIIQSASSVSGSQEDINEALACAYFTRAYCFFELATYYCKPWSDANAGSLGVPRRLGLDYDENISRGTLQQTYDQIFSDLEAAAQVVTNKDVPEMKWRVSECAINALYARIYLARGEFDKALEYANKALTNAPELYDFNTFQMGRSQNYSATNFWPALTLKYCETNTWNQGRILYDYTEWIYADLAYYPTQLALPSHDLVSLYDHDNDLRFKLFFVEHGVRRMANVHYDWYRYDPWYDGRYSNAGLTTAEVMLIKAESQVRLGQWQEGLATLTPLRQARYVSGTATALTANSQAEALQKVLQERRRELPFYFRVGDIKRFSVTSDTSDDVTVVRDFFEQDANSVNTAVKKTYTIPGDDPSWAFPIYQTEINSSKGAIEQNPE